MLINESNSKGVIRVIIMKFEKATLMTRSEFIQVNDRPCRFKLKSGKEVYGVIWENPAEQEPVYFFATLGERFDARNKKNVWATIDLEDVVGAELINSSLVG